MESDIFVDLWDFPQWNLAMHNK